MCLKYKGTEFLWKLLFKRKFSWCVIIFILIPSHIHILKNITTKIRSEEWKSHRIEQKTERKNMKLDQAFIFVYYIDFFFCVHKSRSNFVNMQEKHNLTFFRSALARQSRRNILRFFLINFSHEYRWIGAQLILLKFEINVEITVT